MLSWCKQLRWLLLWFVSSHMAFVSRFAGCDVLSRWSNPIWLPLEALGRQCWGIFQGLKTKLVSKDLPLFLSHHFPPFWIYVFYFSCTAFVPVQVAKSCVPFLSPSVQYSMHSLCRSLSRSRIIRDLFLPLSVPRVDASLMCAPSLTCSVI